MSKGNPDWWRPRMVPLHELFARDDQAVGSYEAESLRLELSERGYSDFGLRPAPCPDCGGRVYSSENDGYCARCAARP